MLKHNDGTERANVYGSEGLVAIRVNGAWYYIHKDHLGSTKLVVDMGNDQAVCRYACPPQRKRRREYDPYGKIVNASVNPQIKYLFTNQEMESDISTASFWNFRARAYDSEIGMFYAPDPAKDTYSPFGYVGGNPISFIDPTGKVTISAGSGAALSYAYEARWAGAFGGGGGSGTYAMVDQYGFTVGYTSAENVRFDWGATQDDIAAKQKERADKLYANIAAWMGYLDAVVAAEYAMLTEEWSLATSLALGATVGFSSIPDIGFIPNVSPFQINEAPLIKMGMFFGALSRDGKTMTGTFNFDGKTYNGISGPWGNGKLPEGTYIASNLAKVTGESYTDPNGLGWFVKLTPTFRTDRTGLGIHPDGSTWIGTQGCVGINGSTQSLYNQLNQYFQNSSYFFLWVRYNE